MATDKMLHFISGFLICFTVSFGMPSDKQDGYWRLIPPSTAIAAGIAKEVYDSQQPGNRFDSADLAYTAAGGLTAWGMYEGGKYLYKLYKE